MPNERRILIGGSAGANGSQRCDRLLRGGAEGFRVADFRFGART